MLRPASFMNQSSNLRSESRINLIRVCSRKLQLYSFVQCAFSNIRYLKAWLPPAGNLYSLFNWSERREEKTQVKKVDLLGECFHYLGVSKTLFKNEERL